MCLSAFKSGAEYACCSRFSVVTILKQYRLHLIASCVSGMNFMKSVTDVQWNRLSIGQ